MNFCKLIVHCVYTSKQHIRTRKLYTRVHYRTRIKNTVDILNSNLDEIKYLNEE